MSNSPHEEKPIRVLLIDDDKDDYLLTREIFAEISHDRFELDWVSDYESGLDALCDGKHDVYLLDFRLGLKTGLDLLAEATTRTCHGPVILLTGQSEWEVDLAAMQAGAADFLEKGRLDATLLERSIRYAIQKDRAEKELERKVKERTAELAQANEILRSVDRRKDEFLATLAHELRNPLAPIRNALEIIRLAPNPKALEGARKIMERQVSQLVRLIDDLLDVSRMTTGKLKLMPEPIYISEVVHSAIEISQPLIDKARVRLHVSIPETPLRILADRIRMTQVFSNLLNNAAKYNEPGGEIFLNVSAVPESISVSVRDTGLGISSEMMPKLFDLFVQIDRTLNRSQGGLGIGLSLVHWLVEMHSGKVTVKSDGPGKGAEFIVELPHLSKTENHDSEQNNPCVEGS